MRVKECRIQRAPITRTVDGEEHVSFIRIELYIEFDDGNEVISPAGKKHFGRGTIARYNFRHGTWSVQPPEHWKTCRMGYFFDSFGNPELERPEIFRGMATEKFLRQYSKSFTSACLTEKVIMGV